MADFIHNVRHDFRGIILFCAFILFLHAGVMAGTSPELDYKDGKLEINAINAPLMPILESLAQKADLEIFVSDELGPLTISAQFTDKELEDGLRTMLRGINYALVYRKSGDSWPVSKVYIYPVSKNSGRLVHVGPAKEVALQENVPSEGQKILMVDQYGDHMFMGTDEGGALVPSRSMSNLEGESVQAAVNTPWFKTQHMLELREKERFQELLLMNKKVETAEDPDKREALSMAYAEALADFHRMKVSNLNKIEAIKRIYQNREMKK